MGHKGYSDFKGEKQRQNNQVKRQKTAEYSSSKQGGKLKMSRRTLQEIDKYREFRNRDNEKFVLNESGEIDYTKKIVDVKTRNQIDNYNNKKSRMHSISFESFSVDQQSSINNSFFIFMIYQPMKIFLKDYPELTKGDYARLVYLSTFLKRHDTKVKKNSKTYASRADIKEMLDVPERTARDFLKRTESHGLTFFDSNGLLHLSEVLFKNGRVGGTNKTRNFARIFINNTRELYKQFKKGKAIEKLGVLYSLVPYLDLKYNVLCKNANSDNIDNISDIEPLTMRELAEILGYTDSFALKRSLRALKVEINGVTFSAVAFHEVGELDDALITLSPFFIYRDMPSDWLTKETHLVFYHEIIRQLKTKDEYKTDSDIKILEYVEEVLNDYE